MRGSPGITVLALALGGPLLAADPFLLLHRDLEQQVAEVLSRAQSPPAEPQPGPEPRPSRSGLAPFDLLSVARIESSLNPAALSPQGARGMWQLMPDTARRFGLRVDVRRDDRIDPARSAVAAMRYLTFLGVLFGDPKLALAAYNAGESRVLQAIERGGTRDFYELARRRLLPEETRRYVPAVLAEMSKGEKHHE